MPLVHGKCYEWRVIVTNGLLLVDSGNNTSRPAVIAELAQVNALPCAKIQSSVGDGNSEADTKQRAFCMRGHIVGTFKHMVVVWFVLLDNMIHNLLHVASHVRVGIFIDAEGT